MTPDLQGLLLCSRYSFAPNHLHFCGPEKQRDLQAYVSRSTGDAGLSEILDRFETLYPYLVLIASQNHIQDPYDRRVVEAYWVGNQLLRRVPVRAYARHLTESLRIQRKMKAGDVTPMIDRVVSGVPHHTNHVLNIFIRTGHMAIVHTLPTMDSCRISWGRVTGGKNRSPDTDKSTVGTRRQYFVNMQHLEYGYGVLRLGNPVLTQVTGIGIHPGEGEWVSMHWGYICDVLTPRQRKNLQFYSDEAIRSANSGAPVTRSFV